MITSIRRRTTVSRRSFIVDVSAVAGGLALGFHVPVGVGAAKAQAKNSAGSEVNAWVVVKPDDTCVIRIERSEMGQGTRTGLAQLVTEELECDWRRSRPKCQHPVRTWPASDPGVICRQAAAAAFAVRRNACVRAELQRG
jgi:CO/xanthine dehydrogenase Mo-binding subunit